MTTTGNHQTVYTFFFVLVFLNWVFLLWIKRLSLRFLLFSSFLLIFFVQTSKRLKVCTEGCLWLTSRMYMYDAQINKFMISLDARRRLFWNAFSRETHDMISAVGFIIMLCSSNKANRCEPSTSWPSSCLIVARSCFMGSCIRAITHLGLHIVALH